MLETITTDLRQSFDLVWNGAEPSTLTMMGLAALSRGITMNHLRDIAGRCSQALIVLGVIYVLYGGMMSDARFTVPHWESQLAAGWNHMMGFSIPDLLGYFIVLGIGVLAVFGVKSIVKR